MTAVTSLARVVADPRTNDVVRVVLTNAGRPGPTVTGCTPPRARPRRLALSTQAVVALALLLVLVVLVSLAPRRRCCGATSSSSTSSGPWRSRAAWRRTRRWRRRGHRVRPDPGGPVQREAERVRRETGALYVVVTDDRGIRYSHPSGPTSASRVSTSPDAALAGREVVTIERAPWATRRGARCRCGTPSGGSSARSASASPSPSWRPRPASSCVLLGLVALGAARGRAASARSPRSPAAAHDARPGARGDGRPGARARGRAAAASATAWWRSTRAAA